LCISVAKVNPEFFSSSCVSRIQPFLFHVFLLHVLEETRLDDQKGEQIITLYLQNLKVELTSKEHTHDACNNTYVRFPFFCYNFASSNQIHVQIISFFSFPVFLACKTIQSHNYKPMLKP